MLNFCWRVEGRFAYMSLDEHGNFVLDDLSGIPLLSTGHSSIMLPQKLQAMDPHPPRPPTILPQPPPIRTVGQGLGDRVSVADEPFERLVIVDGPGRFAPRAWAAAATARPSGTCRRRPSCSQATAGPPQPETTAACPRDRGSLPSAGRSSFTPVYHRTDGVPLGVIQVHGAGRQPDRCHLGAFCVPTAPDSAPPWTGTGLFPGNSATIRPLSGAPDGFAVVELDEASMGWQPLAVLVSEFRKVWVANFDGTQIDSCLVIPGILSPGMEHTTWSK